MDEGKAEIYRYIRDEHDKRVARAESLTSRFGNIRLIAGLILTMLSFALTVASRSVENAHGISERALTIAPLVFFAIAVYFVTRALLAIPDLVGTIHIYYPATDSTVIGDALAAEELPADEVIQFLSQNYLEAIDKNIKAHAAAGKQLDEAVISIRRGLFATIAFLVFTLIASIVRSWLF